MTFEQIENVIENKNPVDSVFEIRFKSRPSLVGFFLRASDFKELSRKNLWRIVAGNNLQTFKQSGDENLARIFNGSEFIKLERLQSQ
jgi:hypothetical protein